MDHLQRVEKGGRRLKNIVTLLLAAVPVGWVLFWVFVNQIDPTMRHLPVTWEGELPVSARMLGFVVSLPEAAVILYGLVILRRLFGLYARGSIFQAENVACFRRLGWAMLVMVALEIVSTPFMSVALTWHLGPGHRQGVLQLGSDHALTLFTGMVVLTIAWVMDEGRKLREEQDLFV